MNNERYYKLLGLDKSSNPSEDVIKKAYKKKALKWHPDRNRDKKEEAEKNFKDISEAYQVLSDPEKRKLYDQYGEDILKNGLPENKTGGVPFGMAGGMPHGVRFTHVNMNHHGIDPHELFKNMFNNDMDTPFRPFVHNNHNFRFSNSFNTNNSNSIRKSTSITNIECSLEDLYNGVIKKLRITENFGYSDIITINIKKGWKAGTKIIYPRKNGGNITFIIREKKHKWFKRINNDLVWDCIINQKQANKGFKLSIPLLNGETAKFLVQPDEIKQSNLCSRISGKGMPIKNQNSFGDLIINFKIN